jgi:arylsulfatase
MKFLPHKPTLLAGAVALACFSYASAQTELPLAKPKSASIANESLQQSKHQRRKQASPLPADAPNVLIIMLDDAGYAQADTVGGAVHTPALTRIADTGIRYNAFHTSAISSATRASLLTGRNHHRAANGMIAELGTDWDGYTGEIPKSTATIPEVLRHYGYLTSAFGKWHNTPPLSTTAMGPFDRWPTGHGFDTFYGFMAGETSQWEPRLYRNTTPVEPPKDPNYHLTEDLAEQAVHWLRQRQAYAPDKPFFMYWTPGAVHAPHHVNKQWADKYKGRFDAGWDVYREEAFARQKALGWIPQDAVLPPRPDTLPAWDSLSPEEKRFHARSMEVYAGFLEHTDTQVGKLIDELERSGQRDNTLILYVFSDNGASAEGMLSGTIAEMNALNGLPTTTAQHLAVLQRDLGGLDALGGPLTDAHYHAGWAWAGSTPFNATKLVAGYFGGTRTPLAISWPSKIKADPAVRAQFHHVNDIAATLYDVLGITPPKRVDGVAQEPLDGVSMAYSFADAGAKGRKPVQYFENLGSRAIYEDGWIASVFGPRTPWLPGIRQFIGWNPAEDKWSLYKLDGDFSQARDVAEQNPEKLARLKERFDEQARANKVYPLGAGIYPFLDPSAMIQSPYREWRFDAGVRRLPEFAAPNLRSRDSDVVVDGDFSADAKGVIYALGGNGGGVTMWIDNGTLHYEYNLLLLKRIKISAPLPGGRHRIEMQTRIASPKPGSPGELILLIDGREAGRAQLPYTPPLGFTASETFDVGIDLGSPVALDYHERAPFALAGGRIESVHVRYP